MSKSKHLKSVKGRCKREFQSVKGIKCKREFGTCMGNTELGNSNFKSVKGLKQNKKEVCWGTDFFFIILLF